MSPPSGVPQVMPPILSPQVSPPRSDSEEKSNEVAPQKDHAIDPNIPDATDWTTEQVYQYFYRLFPKEADTFRHHVRIFVINKFKMENPCQREREI